MAVAVVGVDGLFALVVVSLSLSLSLSLRSRKSEASPIEDILGCVSLSEDIPNECLFIASLCRGIHPNLIS